MKNKSLNRRSHTLHNVIHTLKSSTYECQQILIEALIQCPRANDVMIAILNLLEKLGLFFARKEQQFQPT